ncbi:hypothetical protein L1887_03767 [Cichorium endivia]|nr:hypothetical protein L1887_03767 [Cichorium endivia]
MGFLSLCSYRALVAASIGSYGVYLADGSEYIQLAAHNRNLQPFAFNFQKSPLDGKSVNLSGYAPPVTEAEDNSRDAHMRPASLLLADAIG